MIKSRHALLIPGQLRCYKRSRELLFKLSKYYDLFVVTEAKYRSETKDLISNIKLNILIIEDDENAFLESKNVCLPRAQQWFKYLLSITILRNEERSFGFRYKTIIKLRTDFNYSNYDLLFSPDSIYDSNLFYARSDIVFGGPRHIMLTLAGLHEAIPNRYLDANSIYFPINPYQILRSDPSAYRWDMFRYPTKIMGNPISSKAIYELINLKKLELMKYRHREEEHLTSGRGNPHLATERVFAHYLNQLGITVKSHRMFSGALYEDRFGRASKEDGPPEGGWHSNNFPWDYHTRFPYPC